MDKFVVAFEEMVGKAADGLETFAEYEKDNAETYNLMMKQCLELSQKVKDNDVRFIITGLMFNITRLTRNGSMITNGIAGFSTSLIDLLKVISEDNENEVEDNENRSDKLRELAKKGVANGYTTDEIKEVFKRV